ncbi:MAG: CDP-alcohol phosphatidyltransferase family protein [Dysgonamonadaceae bacterium]|jgi:phosphatidylglycerophosphate synthase|nr:CDP-alcohol phosphatidyltransferase family protein [Dysgonamonadaceae bacterium]
MEQKTSSHQSALKRITKGRERTNILQKPEQNLIAFLVQRIPAWVTPDGLTGIGMVGSLITMFSFFLAYYLDCRAFLLLGILGFIINWFGDSLDGRLAYYRKTPRKWYGFSLDYIVDWFANICIGIGYIVYVDGVAEIFGFGFVVLYGWAMMMALLRYKVVGKYTIDSGFLGPTEVRVLISIILVLEVLIKDSIIVSSIIICIVLLIINIKDFRSLLVMADRRDKREKIEKRNKENATL